MISDFFSQQAKCKPINQFAKQAAEEKLILWLAYMVSEPCCE